MKKILLASVIAVMCLGANVTAPVAAVDDLEGPLICHTVLVAQHLIGPGAMDVFTMSMSVTVQDVQGAGWQLLCYDVTTPTFDPFVVNSGILPRDGTFVVGGTIMLSHSNDEMWFVYRVENFTDEAGAQAEKLFMCRD